MCRAKNTSDFGEESRSCIYIGSSSYVTEVEVSSCGLPKFTKIELVSYTCNVDHK